MKIDSATIGMESARYYKSVKSTTRRFSVMDYQGAFAQNQGMLQMAQQDASKEMPEQKEKQGNMDLGNEGARQNWRDYHTGLVTPLKRATLRNSKDQMQEDIRQLTLRYILDLIFGTYKRKKKENAEENTEEANNSSDGNDLQEYVQVMGRNVSARTVYFSQETQFYEREETSFSTTGTVRTADGREIDFNVNVAMSREFAMNTRTQWQEASVKLCDPLVINLDGNVADVSDQNFYFDIDADGEKDSIPMLGAGSGFLALDKNGDGIIGDGSELFGTKSGDGFKDLQAYDEDGNGWIDENDSVWEKLQIWCKDENGVDHLYRLKDKGVGAICLDHLSTNYAIKDNVGNARAMIRSSGVFLYENAMAGTIQHVDLARSSYQKEA